jgi:hypothetical protein
MSSNPRVTIVMEGLRLDHLNSAACKARVNMAQFRDMNLRMGPRRFIADMTESGRQVDSRKE